MNKIFTKIKECPPDKILNPETNNCVLKSGAIGKKILKNLLIKNDDKTIELKKPNKCPDDKILNPDTNRCVNKSGAIGKKILMNLLNKTKETKLKETKLKETKLKKDNIKISKSELESIIKKIELEFGKIHKSGINSIFEHIIKSFSINNYILDNNNIKKFIYKSDDRIKKILEKIIKNTEVISINNFLNNLLINIYIFIKEYIKKYRYYENKIYLFSNKTNTNNVWMIKFVKCMFNCITNNKIDIILIDSNNVIQSINTNDTIIFVDDCYYTGNEFRTIIQENLIKFLYTKSIDIFILVPYISNNAIHNITNIFNQTFNYQTSKLLFAYKKQIIYNIKKILTDSEIKLLNYYYGINKTNSENKKTYMIYFQHNLTNEKTLLIPIYSGIIANKNNMRMIKDSDFYNLSNYDKEKIYNNLDVIHLIKHTNKYYFIYHMSDDNLNELSYLIQQMNNIMNTNKQPENNLLNDNKKIVENFFGKPKNFKLSDLLKDNFKLYPLDHSLDKNAVEKFINASDDIVKNICNKIIKNTQHISFETFLKEINICIYDLLVYIINKKNNSKNIRPIFVYINGVTGTTFEITKSNYWIYTYFVEFIKYITNDKIKVELFNPIKFFTNLINDDDILIMIDDCIYSGQQMGNEISNIYNKNLTKFNLYILVPFITNIGINRIYTDFKYNPTLSDSKCSLIFPKTIRNPKVIEDVLSNNEILILKNYYKAFLDISNKTLLYFDHKLADLVSTLTPFYLGIVPSTNNLNILKNKFGIVNNLYTSRFDFIKIEDIYESLDIIPIIKNCSNYTKKLDLMTPECPATPYKKPFKKFMNLLIKKNKTKNLKFSLDNKIRKEFKEKKILKHSY